MVADRLSALLDFLKDDPDDPFLRFALASEYLKKGQDERALEIFQRLVKDCPDYVGTYYHLAKLQVKLGLNDEARAVYGAGISEASRQGDRHSESELRSALMEMDIDY